MIVGSQISRTERQKKKDGRKIKRENGACDRRVIRYWEGDGIGSCGRRCDGCRFRPAHRPLGSLAQRSGGTAKVLTAYVLIEDQARGMVAEANAAPGKLDMLVNDAGVMLLGPIAHAGMEDWRRMMETNVLGLMYASHAVQAQVSTMPASGAWGHPRSRCIRKST